MIAYERMDWPMPPHSDRAAVDGFITELRRVWKMAGPPSYQDFEKLSMKVKGSAEAGGMYLPRSTTQDILAGRRQQPPRWRWVATFITVLRMAAAEVGVDPGSLGTLAEWKEKHEAACAAVAAATQLAHVAGGGPAVAPGSAADPEYGDTRIPRQASGLVSCEDDIQRDAALASLLRTVGQQLWHDYRDFVPGWLGAYLSLEPAASLIRVYDTTLVPELLQTEEYADAAIRTTLQRLGQSAQRLGKAAVSRLVELRMRRQQLLIRPDTPLLWAIIDETVLRRRLGSAETMRAQIRRLIEISQKPSVTIQVIPLGIRIYTVVGSPITFLRFPHADSPDMVYLEQLTGALYLTCERDVSPYREVLEYLGIEALNPFASTDFLRKVLLEI